ncbi:hypothetical protein WAF17_05375 [Bernardetia sp. ABR2-2B]|uniref:hypothetical protein n=1 Tax=Bernardetia sp. ABR2-2B TaxID=3127472 RepID=UPI0030D0C1EB
MLRINSNFVSFALFFISMFICSSSFGQLDKGTFIINESFTFDTDNTEYNIDDYSSDNKSIRYNSTTLFGYVFKENQEVGILLSLEMQKHLRETSFQDNTTKEERITKGYGIGVYYKKYIRIMEKLSFFVSPQLDYLKRNSKTEDERSNPQISESNSHKLGANIYTGLLYHPTKRFGLSMNLIGTGINYYSTREANRKDNSLNTYSIASPNLGIQFMF